MKYRGKHYTDNLADGYLGSGTILKKAISKNGEDKFKVDILEFCSSIDAMNQAESKWVNQEWIDSVHSYNITLGGCGGHGLPVNKGYKPTAETVEKIRKSSTGRKHSEATKAKIRQYHIDNPPTAEQSAKMSAANTGKIVSDDARNKMKESWKTRMPDSEETRNKKSQSATLKWAIRRQTGCSKGIISDGN